MAENKTQVTTANVDQFVAEVNEAQRADSQTLLKMFRDITKEQPKLWSNGLVGFGDLHYKGASGREGDWFRLGFAPRKGNMTIYFLCDMRRLGDSLAKLGKHSASGGCLHIKKLSDIHLPTLKSMLVEAYKITPTEQVAVSTKTKTEAKKVAAKKVAAKKVTAKKVAKKTSTVKGR